MKHRLFPDGIKVSPADGGALGPETTQLRCCRRPVIAVRCDRASNRGGTSEPEGNPMQALGPEGRVPDLDVLSSYATGSVCSHNSRTISRPSIMRSYLS
jgi:hypothetical protein